MTWIISQIPWWMMRQDSFVSVWVIVTLMIAVPVMYFFYPILIPLWNALPRPVKIALGFVAALFGAFVFGMNKASRAAKEHQRQLDTRAVQKRQEVHDAVQKLDKPTVDKRLDKWMRD